MLKADDKRKILGALIAGISLFSLIGCGSTGPAAKDNNPAAVNEQQVTGDDVGQSDEGSKSSEGNSVEEDVTKGAELLCLAESEDEAKAIAEQYGIELVDFSYGVATFHTEDDPQKVIDMGKEKGYPELSLNGSSKLN